MFKFSLTLDEDADIFTITGEHCKWEGKLCRIPRTAIQELHASSKEFQQAGVYFLIGEEKGCLKAYVGQAGIRSKDKTFIKRMKEHDADAKKDWFKEVFFLTINTDRFKQDLDNAQLDYLELEFYNRVPEGIRTNVNKPQETYMARDRKNELNELIKPVPLLMKVLGRDIFNTPQSPPPQNSNIFRLDDKTANKHKVQARFEVPFPGLRKTIVLEGSVIARQRAAYPDYMSPEAKEAIQRWFTGHPGQRRLDEKIEFESPTAAVAFVTGHHMSGPAVMVRMTDDKKKETLAEITKTLRDGQKQAKGKESLS